ncbi:hypothetical protein [Wenzhouxiangella sp. EGI_FJ10305]|uniref:hypothetical protein n=1 Tax=Wenzhouxiangella sp. EGI_FJ10305 TaxID=3243768 RepID=UPI0035D5C7CA
MDSSRHTGRPVQIERVRGRLDENTRAGLRAFWKSQDVLEGGQAEVRLPRVLSRLIDEAGRTVGSSSATAARIPAIGNQWLQVYRCLIAPDFDTPERWMQMLATGWDILSEASERTAEPHCIGVLVPVADPAILKAWPQAIWPETRFLHAGVARNGAALRLRYFEDARIDTEAGHERGR